MSAPITITGNLVEDPELRVTQSGHAVANFRVATSERVQDRATGDWRDGETTYFTVTAWRRLAENVAESLRKGDQAVIIGQMRQRNYETGKGEKRTVYEVEAESVGTGLGHATAVPSRNVREGVSATC